MISMEEFGLTGRKRSLIDMIQHFITSSNTLPAFVKLAVAV